MKFIHIFVLLALISLSSAEAREEFWYVGAGGGTTYLDDKDDIFDDSESAASMVKAYVGYRVSTYIAVEIDYSYYGDYKYTYSGPHAVVEDEVNYQTLSFSIVVMYPLIWDDFELYTPVGGTLVDVDYGVDNEKGYGYKVGFGVAYTPTEAFTIRLGTEYQILRYDSRDGNNLQQNLTSVYGAVQYNF